MVMKAQNKLANGQLAELKVFFRQDQRTPWLYLAVVTVLIAACKLTYVDPQEPLPAALITFTSLLALFKM